MQVEWSASAILGFVLFALNILLAFFVLNARPDRLQNRFLAALIFLQGFVLGIRRGFLEFLQDPAAIAAANLVRVMVIQLYTAAFLLFLSTLKTPWVRPIQSTPVRVVVVLVAAVSAGYAFWIGADRMLPFLTGRGGSHFPDVWPMILIGIFLPLLLWPYGLLAVVSAHRRTPEESQRERGTWFVRAFVVYMALLLFWLGLTMVRAGDWHDYIADGGNVLFLLMMTYGILKDQIFDIDLRLKAATTRGLLAGVFVLAIFAVGETVEILVEETAGTVAALLTAGVLALSFRPLEQALHRVTDRLMPHVLDSEAYRDERRHKVYVSALEDAVYDGIITPRERKILQGLAGSLQIPEPEAERLEREVLRRAGGRSGNAESVLGSTEPVLPPAGK